MTWNETLEAIDAQAAIETDDEIGLCPATAKSIAGAKLLVGRMKHNDRTPPISVQTTTWGNVVMFWDYPGVGVRLEVYDELKADTFIAGPFTNPQYLVYDIANF